MNAKNKEQVINLQVTEGLSVAVLPNLTHEFLMTTKEVAQGYGTSKYAIYKAFQRNSSEMIEGKHFIKGVDILSTPNLQGIVQPNSILFTKRGIVRLGFFIKSQRAKLFRDWAEDLIIAIDEQKDLFGAIIPMKELPKKRNHNRLTQERMIGILSDVARIEDKELRLSLINKLGV